MSIWRYVPSSSIPVAAPKRRPKKPFENADHRVFGSVGIVCVRRSDHGNLIADVLSVDRQQHTLNLQQQFFTSDISALSTQAQMAFSRALADIRPGELCYAPEPEPDEPHSDQPHTDPDHLSGDDLYDLHELDEGVVGQRELGAA